jgi:flagellar biosynthesis/type III secretory pathway protein FliH
VNGNYRQNEVEAMTIHYDIETDGLYLQGLEEGREEGIEQGIERGLEKGIEQGLKKGLEQGAQLKEREIIKNLWSLQEFSLEKIALLSSTSLERVIEVISAHLQVEGQSEAAAVQSLKAYQAKFV